MTDILSPAQQKMLAAYEFHTGAEFVTHRTEDAIATMVPDPYVALLPALTGGNGAARCEDFYEHHFIFNMPPDMELVPVTRIVGAEHIVEESVFRFTHTRRARLDAARGSRRPGRRVEVRGGVDREDGGREARARAHLLGPGARCSRSSG